MAHIFNYYFCKLCALSTLISVLGALSLGMGGWIHLATSNGFSSEPFYYYMLGACLLILAYHISDTHECKY